MNVIDRDDFNLADPTTVEQPPLPIGKETFENLSGTAGTGKTFTSKRLIEESPRGSIVLAATTGIAAVNLGEGTTINAALRYFDTNSLKESYVGGHLQSIIRKLRRTGTQRIIIDEKSMMNGEQLTYITRAAREVNEGKITALESIGAGDGEDYTAREESQLPPIGITLVGDFGQLPPVPDKDPATGRNKPLLFAFDSAEWPLYAEHTHILTKIWRQDNQAFVNALHAVRAAQIRSALDYFTPDRFVSSMDDAFDGTTIFAKNDEVERYNMMRMDALRGEAMRASAVRVGTQRGDWKQIPDTLTLKDGALVMVLANRRVYEDEFDEKGRILYANGDLGTIVGKNDNGAWLVSLKRNGRTVPVYPIIRENLIPLEPGRKKELLLQLADKVRAEYIEAGKPLADTEIDLIAKGRLETIIRDKSEVIGSITYMPLRAAYGCTVHKTQGLTLDQVQVNIRDPFFKHPSMLFVALSRARTIEGLRIIGTQGSFIERCRMEPRVTPWL